MPVPRISKETLKARLDGGDPVGVPTLVDARLKYPYEHSAMKLPGAIRIAPTDLGAMPSLPHDRDIVAYDSDPHELSSSKVAAELIRRGYKASALEGGIAAWIEAKLPTEAKEAPKQAAPAPGSLKD